MLPDPMPDPTQLHESFDNAFSESTVSGNLIQNVKLLGRVSRNNRTYSEQAISDAARLYENVGVYFDHPTDRELRDRKGVRSVHDLAGKVRNPRVVGSEVRGDIQVLDFGESSPAKFLKALAEQMPDAVGFSHRASGMLVKGDNGDVVESLDHVFAHELVTDPATTAGLFESIINDVPEDEDDTMKFGDITLEQLHKERPDLVEAVEKNISEASDVEALRKENKDLRTKLDEAQVAERERAHGEMVATKLAEAKLPERAVTKTFRKLLDEAETAEAVDALIADRKAIVGKSGGPRSAEDTRDDFEEGDEKEFGDEQILEAYAFLN